MTIAEQLARLCAPPTSISKQAIAKSVDAVHDAIIAAIAGIGTPAVLAAQTAARDIWGRGVAPVWFSGEKLTVPGAAFVNASLVSAMDLDDGHRTAVGHPGAGIIPAVLATIARYGGDRGRALIAIAIGYEVAVRIASSRDYSTLTTMVSGPWIGQGVAAAAAYLRKLSPMQTAQAIAIAGASAPNLSAVGYSKFMGNHLKEGIPWATATGLSAVDLALAGYSGPIDLLDNPDVHDKAILLDGLGEQWAVSDIYFKPYSCCRWAHAAMDAVLYLQNEQNFLPSDVIGIEISTFAWALNLNNEQRPRTLESAQYSIPFCVALVLTQGQDAFLPMRSDSLDDPDTLSLADRVSLKIVAQYESMFPQRVPAQVKISTATGDLVHEVLEPLGEQSNPMSLVQMNRKFSTVADRVLSPGGKQKMATAINAFRIGKFTGLQNALGNPIDAASLLFTG